LKSLSKGRVNSQSPAKILKESQRKVKQESKKTEVIKKKPIPFALKLLRILLGLIVLLVASYFLMKSFAPDVLDIILDKILYSEEELRIINYQLPVK